MHAVIWIDTDGEFYVLNCPTLERAVSIERMFSESGLPTMILSREQFISQVSGS